MAASNLFHLGNCSGCLAFTCRLSEEGTQDEIDSDSHGLTKGENTPHRTWKKYPSNLQRNWVWDNVSVLGLMHRHYFFFCWNNLFIRWSWNSPKESLRVKPLRTKGMCKDIMMASKGNKTTHKSYLFLPCLLLDKVTFLNLLCPHPTKLLPWGANEILKEINNAMLYSVLKIGEF